ncbi:PsbP-related protein [Mycolicibacterium tusciae]|uniref:PsbP-related protein n=1 Tax=Mycolicibacterium tusciae TaxID=75922 RepID=UPI00024A3654|nr:PsbP-related protein [Mycolicibacterium tusciae]
MTTRRTILKAVAGSAAAAAVLAGCGAATSPAGSPATNQPAASPTAPAAEYNPPGDIPDNQAFVVYTAADNSYSVKYPEGWAQTAVGADVVFSDKFNSITLSPHDGFYQPTEDFARTVEMPQIAAETRGFAPGQVSTVARPAGQVVVISYQGDSAPSPVTGKSVKQDVVRYEYSRSGRGVVVTVAAPVGSDNVDPWRTVTDSFTWLR